MCLDAGYVGAQPVVEAMGYVGHIRGRGEERHEHERNPQYQSRRWVVEVCHSWLNRFRKLLVRYDLVRYDKEDMQLFGITAFCLCHYCLAADYSCSSWTYSRISS